ncbi:hypothetical protein CBS101457_005371 [Exobasidium rhododendri]|nr:hypothetical protein CBS101457_005371 [Exobasidium rhododendri]
MQIPCLKLSALVGPFFALTVLHGQVEAVPAGTPTTPPVCKPACDTPASCAPFAKWTAVDSLSVTLSHERGVPGSSRPAPYDKKQWWKKGGVQGKETFWGGHILNDGSMKQWTYGLAPDANSVYIYKYDLGATVPAKYYWQGASGDCVAPANAFAAFSQLASVSVMIDPTAKPSPAKPTPPAKFPSGQLPSGAVKCAQACVQTATEDCSDFLFPLLWTFATDAVKVSDGTDATRSNIKTKEWKIEDKNIKGNVFSGKIASDGTMEMTSAGPSVKGQHYTYRFYIDGSDHTSFYYLDGGDHCASDAGLFPVGLFDKITAVRVSKKLV